MGNTVTTPPDRPKWEFAPFLNPGNGDGPRTDSHFFAAGFQTARTLTPCHFHAGPPDFADSSWSAINVMHPFSSAYTPAAHTDIVAHGPETGL